MKKTKNIFIVKLFLSACLLVFSFILGAKVSLADYLTNAQCTSQGGTCNWVSNTCNYDEDSVGLCQGGPLSQGACCKKKANPPTGYMTNAQCSAQGGTCNWVSNSCDAVTEDSVGLCQGGPTSQGACCKKKVTPPANPAPANPTPANPAPANPTNPASGAASPAGTLVPCGVGAGNANCTLCHLVLGFKNIYDYLLALLLAATTLVIVVAGVMYMVSAGSKGMIEKAKSAFTYALTAMILGLTAWLIINATLSALGYTKVGNWWTFTCNTTQTKGPTGGTGGGTLPANTGTGNTGGTGCGAVVNNINSMNGWTYSQGSDRMSPGVGDCSSTTERAYTNAGCKDPGGNTSAMYSHASQFSGAGNLKAGDALVRQGHVGICLVDGCAQIMGASTAGGIHPSSGSSMINDPNIRVIKASDYCPASSC